MLLNLASSVNFSWPRVVKTSARTIAPRTRRERCRCRRVTRQVGFTNLSLHAARRSSNRVSFERVIADRGEGRTLSSRIISIELPLVFDFHFLLSSHSSRHCQQPPMAMKLAELSLLLSSSILTYRSSWTWTEHIVRVAVSRSGSGINGMTSSRACVRTLNNPHT